MMTETQTNSIGLSMEAVPAGRAMPDWLVDSLLSGRKLMVIHPTEAARKQAISNLLKQKGGGIIDTTHHLTMARLVGILHLDLRLPAVLENDGPLFEKSHRALAEAAKEYGFPLLQPNPQHRWSRSRSRRLLSLHRELISLANPWDWPDDPGAQECDKVLRGLEKELQATHPARLEKCVWLELKTWDQPPFTLLDVDGIIMLDHACGLSEVEIEILREVSRLCPIHQLVNPGSHRLGFHGEYIEDISSVRSCDDLPDWVPNHSVWAAPGDIDWDSEIGQNRGRTIHHLMVELAAHTHLGLADLLTRTEEDIIIISGDPDALTLRLEPFLEAMGIKLAKPSTTTLDSPSVNRLLSLVELCRGEEAWALSRLSAMKEQIALPMSWPIFDQTHPTHQEWAPRLHIGVLTDIARGFHLLGGRGSLRRWLSTLCDAKPRAGVEPNRASKELEECQWWLACLANWMMPILPAHDREAIPERIIGCSSGEVLPMPEFAENSVEWFDSMLKQIDWAILAGRDILADNCISGLQYLVAAFDQMKNEIDFEADDFYEFLKTLSKNTKIPPLRVSDQNIRILSPEQAQGCETELLILTGIDAETWSLRPASIPWLDEASRMNLGLHRPDQQLRQARHHLRHLLNCADSIIIIDPSLEEGKELSGALDEWFSRLKRYGGVENIDSAPNFLKPDSWHPDSVDRAWKILKIATDEHRLVHRVNAMEVSGGIVRGHRSGILGRDHRQRAGLATIEGRIPASAPLNIKGLFPAAEIDLLADQLSRRADGEDLAKDEIFGFEDANFLIQTADLKLLPSKKKPADGRSAKQWPHLGVKGKSKLSLPVDPRPISPPSTRIEQLDRMTGRSPIALNLPDIWSQGRLQAWLECPRRAWYDRHMYLGRAERIDEDLAAVTRGDIVHLVEEALLRAHGLDQDGTQQAAQPLHLGPISNLEDAWIVVLDTLAAKATWMRRADGISAHRCRDLIGVSPEIWIEWLETNAPIPIGGRLGRMLLADMSLHDVAPIATEWQLKTAENDFISVESFKLRGRIDRVDQLMLGEHFIDQDASEIIPIDFDLGDPIKAKRLVIIRDIKSLDGPGDDGSDQRHLKGIFQELQLALYARAWEIANPGDRVVGVGATQVGNLTQPFVEIDPEFFEICQELAVGIPSDQTHEHYRKPGESLPAKSNAFRAWMRERITTAQRVIANAAAGNIHPEPSKSCSYCPIIESCPSAKRGGW
jgi:hypothetical protein